MLLEDLQIISKVAEFRSITAAAESLDMRTATASAAIKRVEKALGADLFIRTTRHLRLSVAGERYIPKCEEALRTLELAKQGMQDDLDIVEGELRISAPSDLGRNIILPWLDEFMETYPKITLRLHIADRNIDFYRDPVDIALRYGSQTDANLYGFKISDIPRVLCASPSYIEMYGQPEHPNDIKNHNALLYQLHELIDSNWHFSSENETCKIKVKSNRASNDAELVRRWCVSGKGLAKKSSLDMSNDLLAGRLIKLLPDFQPTPTELWLVCPSRQTITPPVRLLRDYLKVKCAEVYKELSKHDILSLTE